MTTGFVSSSLNVVCGSGFMVSGGLNVVLRPESGDERSSAWWLLVVFVLLSTVVEYLDEREIWWSYCVWLV